jgi:DNA processing protein
MDKPPAELHASLVLNAINELGPARFHDLVGHFGSARAALEAGPTSWAQISSFASDLIQKIKADFDQAKKQAEEDFKLVRAKNVQLLFLHSGPYPRLLREIANPPPIIYVLGEDITVERPVVALVGSRRCSYYGEKVAREMSMDLAACGVTTVSGLARGIDTHVHQATLEAGGTTWAVVGNGLSVIYPPENKKLAAAIEKAGALISEFPMDTKPFPGNFPRRNRIIAGLSMGTVLVEGTEKSGSLITARLAAEEGREVFAVPGPVTSELTAAPHRLIRMGAALVEKADDILEELGLRSSPSPSLLSATETPSSPNASSGFAEILGLLSVVPMPKEILAGKLSRQTAALSATLLEMEVKGLIRTLPGGMLVKR